MELIDRIKAGVTAFKDAFCAPRYPMGKPKMSDELLKSYKKLLEDMEKVKRKAGKEKTKKSKNKDKKRVNKKKNG